VLVVVTERVVLVVVTERVVLVVVTERVVLVVVTERVVLVVLARCRGWNWWSSGSVVRIFGTTTRARAPSRRPGGARW
jgi:hypothetical protein